jgi:glutamate N-acetyltransferase/amino-acid N-acetyltransferase
MVGVEGIMTTDTYPKGFSATVGDATITWIAKGSGMIEPNMATMLSYILTDATFDAKTLDRMLREAVHVSYNMLSVDSDTSTSDTCAILANGMAGTVDETTFLGALKAGCIRMTEMLARDGEGAKHLLRITITGARNDDEARRVAKSVVNSPLIKTMVFGADPNVGRLLMAVGKVFDVTIDAAKTHASINGYEVVSGGARVDFDDPTVRDALRNEIVDIAVSLGVGNAAATAYGCDLTQGYIDENAAYYSS